MKSILHIFIVIIISSCITKAQQIIPYSESTKNIKSFKKTTKFKEQQEVKLKGLYHMNLLANDSASKANRDSIQSIQKSIETADSTLAELNDDEATVVFSASSSLNSSEELKSVGGANKVLAHIHLTNALSVSLAYNLTAVKPQSVSRDSIDLISLMFPEAGSTGFTIGSAMRIITGNKDNKKPSTHALSGMLEYSFKQTKFNSTYIDSSGNEVEDGSKEFSALNYNVGLQYMYMYKPPTNPDKPVLFGASVYVHFFNVPNEDAKNFEMVIKDSFNKSSITSVGTKFTLQYKGYVLFGDFRHNFNTKNFSDNNVFKGFVYNIGTMINTDIFRF